MTSTALPLAYDEFTGQRLGKYELLCRLSVGSMAEVFLAARLDGNQKAVVVKRMLPHVRADLSRVKMFLDEARITAAFNHPNIVAVYDLQYENDDLFLAMEFVPGATLLELLKAHRVRGEALPLGLSLFAAREVANALDYAHARRVIHRDIAPKNVMMAFDGSVKLLDFGLAKAMGKSERTALGTVRGTLGYLSPEQMCDEELDHTTDLFSLGIVLHECLTGAPLFTAREHAKLMQQVVFEQIPPPSHANPKVPPAIDEVVMTALRREKAARFPSGAHFARAIDQAAGALLAAPSEFGAVVQRLFPERLEQATALTSTHGDERVQSRFARLTGSHRVPPKDVIAAIKSRAAAPALAAEPPTVLNRDETRMGPLPAGADISQELADPEVPTDKRPPARSPEAPLPEVRPFGLRSLAIALMLAIGLSLLGLSVAAMVDPPLKSRIEALLGR